jgi:O-succinylbenzoate synthase
LDANGGLTFAEAKQWLEWGDRQPKLEFIEQPLPPENFEQLLWLQRNHQTAIALDESVANLRDLKTCYENGWRGIFVVKAAITGFPSQLQTFCQTHDLDLVFSTVFETEVGQKAVLHLAPKIANPYRALGMGGSHWFAD